MSGVNELEWADGALAAAQVLADVLALPAEPFVTLRDAATQRREGAPPYALDIADRPARLAWDFSASVGATATELATRLGHDLTRNAALLVTPEVVEASRASWRERAPDHPAVGLSSADLTRLMEECVRACRRVDRVLDADVDSDERDPLWWRLLEGALDAAPPSLEFVISAGPADRIFLGGAIQTFDETFSDHVYAETGVILPPAKVQLDDGPGATWNVKVCDLDIRVPAPKSGKDLIEQALATLRPWLHVYVTRETTLYRLNAAGEELPQLVRAVRARFTDAFITRSLRALVGEGVTVNDMPLRSRRLARDSRRDNCERRGSHRVPLTRGNSAAGARASRW